MHSAKPSIQRQTASSSRRSPHVLMPKTAHTSPRKPLSATTAAMSATVKGYSAAASGEVASLLTEDALLTLEGQHSEGMTLAQIIQVFASRGVHLSEATFRKYVQQGLLGRSRRVGRKGKHQGSLGLYPATTIRRIQAIKQMMAHSYTIEDIQRSFLRFADELELLKSGMQQILSRFEQEITDSAFPAPQQRGLTRSLQAARRLGDELLSQVQSLERELLSPLARAARERAVSTGKKGSAEDLL